MPQVRRSRIPDAEWEHRKTTIKRLYLDEKKQLEGADSVIGIMRDLHDFHASKAQYETRFKRWGFRKNLKKDDWKAIGRIYRKKKADGEQSEVYLDGKLMPEEKVHKEVARYRGPSTPTYGGEENPPAGVTFCNADQQKLLSDGQDSSSRNRVSATGTELVLLRPTSRTPVSVANRYSPAWDSESMDLRTSPFNAPSPIAFKPRDWVPVDESQLMETFPDLGADIPTLLPWDLMPTSTWSLVQGLSGSLIRNHQALELARPVVAKSRLLLLGEARQSLQTRNSEQIVIKLIVYLCINNFTGSEIVEYEALFQQLEHFSMTQAKALMDAIPEPYLTALQQSILTIAIRFGAVSIVKALIQNGLDVDMATCHFEGDPLTPLQYACRCRHIEMVRVLLGATKDVERSFKMSTISHLFQRDIGPGRLGGTKATLHRIVGRLLILLLQAGIRFQHGDLLDSRFWKDDSLVQAFLRYGKINERARLSFLTDYTCLYIIRYQNDEEAAYCFEVLLGSGIILSPELTTSSLFRQCQRTLCEASSFGHSRVVNLLLAAGVVPVTECLAGATYANSIDLVNRFLAMGIKPNDLMSIEEDEGKHFGNVCTFQREFACNIPAETEPLFLNGDLTSLKTFTTPFAEAIRWQRHDIVALFQRTGKFESIPKLVNGQTRDIYHSVFAGAVEAGNVTLVADLLLSESDPNILSSLSSCFSLATLIGQDQIVSLLLHAGVRPNQTSVPIAVAVRNRRHLRWYLDSGALIVDEVLWLAARWGDADVAKELIMAGASMNIECTTSDTFSSCGICLTLPRPFCTPLGQAIKEGNLDVVQLLLENGADVCLRDHYYSVSALALAVRTGDEAMVRDMLARGADPNDPKALEEATHRSLSMIEILLEAFDHTYPKGNKSFGTRALRQAIWKGDVAHASLFSRYSDANFLDVCHDDGKDVRRNLLSHAIISQNASIVQILLGTGGNPNGTVSLRGSDRGPGFGSGSSRRTVLLEAIWTKDLGIVRLVHESGAAINCAAELGLARTPLQLAAEIGSFEIAEYLIVHGADVNGDPCIFRGGTALQLAAIQGYVGIAEHLVKNGADVNAARGRFQGRTAFEGAAEHGRLDMLLFLYHNGLDIVSDGGEQVRRAVEFANENGQRAAVSLVEQLSQSVASVPSLGLN